MKIVFSFLTGLIMCVMAAAPAGAFVYLETFNTNDGGWEAAGGYPDTLRSSGGVGNSGYLEGRRDLYAPAFQPYGAPAQALAQGNLEATFGSRIRISYYGNIISSFGNQPILHQFGYKDNDNDTYTYWRKTVAPMDSLTDFYGRWEQISFEINTNWTDAQASAEGWHRVVGHGYQSESWATVMEDVYNNSPFYGYALGPAVTAGLDNFKMETVPLPGALWLLGTGLIGFAGWRRRSA